MYERVVVPLDGSKLAEAALPYAEELAGKMGADIVLLTALESDRGREYEEYRTYAKKVARATRYHAGKYTGEGKGSALSVETATRTGDAAQAIIDYVGKGNLDMVIMASHGRSGISRWAVGSVADKVVRASAHQPVMLIRAKESRSDLRDKRVLKKCLVPLDGSVGARVVMPHITRMASRLDMELTLLQVAPRNNGSCADAETYLRSECVRLEMEGLKASYRVSVGAVADGIIDMADELAFDLVAMSTHGRSGISLWSLGSVAEKVFLGGNTPLLLVKQ